MREGAEVKIGDRPLLLWVVVLVAAKPWWPRCGSGTHRGSSRVGEVLSKQAGMSKAQEDGREAGDRFLLVQY